eukprot:1872233-Pleurochrysis_carterae.AAC.2
MHSYVACVPYMHCYLAWVRSRLELRLRLLLLPGRSAPLCGLLPPSLDTAPPSSSLAAAAKALVAAAATLTAACASFPPVPAPMPCITAGDFDPSRSPVGKFWAKKHASLLRLRWTFEALRVFMSQVEQPSCLTKLTLCEAAQPPIIQSDCMHRGW